MMNRHERDRLVAALDREIPWPTPSLAARALMRLPRETAPTARRARLRAHHLTLGAAVVAALALLVGGRTLWTPSAAPAHPGAPPGAAAQAPGDTSLLAFLARGGDPPAAKPEPAAGGSLVSGTIERVSGQDITVDDRAAGGAVVVQYTDSTSAWKMVYLHVTDLQPGECLVVVGRQGSGGSVTAQVASVLPASAGTCATKRVTGTGGETTPGVEMGPITSVSGTRVTMAGGSGELVATIPGGINVGSYRPMAAGDLQVGSCLFASGPVLGPTGRPATAVAKVQAGGTLEAQKMITYRFPACSKGTVSATSK